MADDEGKLTKPNVLYIITHDQGIGASIYAPYGSSAGEKMVSPNLDAVAKQGAMLTTHFGTAPQCSPARGSLITSMHPHVNGLIGLTHRGFELDDKKKTVLHHFINNGYKTKLIGFQHEIQGDPSEIGYQETEGANYGRDCHVLLPEIKRSLEKIKDDNGKDQSWWLTIGLKEVHLSWESWTKEEKWFAPEDVDVPGYLPDTPMVRKHLGSLFAVIKNYDHFVGEVMNYVEELDLKEETIVVITTDHGIAHPRAKGTLYDPGNHDLMIWRNPSRIPGGKKVHSLLSSIDFAPTICEMCGIGPNPDFMGKTYSMVLKSPELEENTVINEYIFTELTYHDVYNPMRSIRSKRFKYIKIYEPEKVPLIKSIPSDIQRTPSFREWVRVGHNTTRDAEEFYDLETDPLEEHNLAMKNPDHPELIRLKGIMDDFLKATNDAILEGPYLPPDGVNINNAEDFEHLPKFFVVTKGILNLDEDGLVALKMQLSPNNPMLYNIPAIEFLEEFLEVPVELITPDGTAKGSFTTSEGASLVFNDAQEKSQVKFSECLSEMLGKNVSLTVTRYRDDEPFTIKFKYK
ncbi:MAG: sulfatase [Candidatus Hodarchaeota archaeon]